LTTFLAVLVSALFVVSINAASIQPTVRAINNQLYRRYVCVHKPDGFRALVPGSCSQYYECQSGVALVSTCSRFFDSKVQGCVNYNTGCIETQAITSDKT
ncbi:hypothetical protein KR067_011503, partial [Drosophila pandora]